MELVHTLSIVLLVGTVNGFPSLGMFKGIADKITEVTLIRNASDITGLSSLGGKVSEVKIPVVDGQISDGEALRSVGVKVAGGIQAVSTPIETVVVQVASSQCSQVKELLSLSRADYLVNKPDVNDITLRYLSSSMNITYNITEAGSLIPQSSWYRSDEPFIIYSHGFTDDPTKSSFSRLREAFSAAGLHNVYALDGSPLIYFWYLRSSTFVSFMGERLGQTVAELVKNGVPLSKIHLIGHSLGAQTSGFAGKTFFNLTGKLLPRITGLDPAGPCFTHVELDDRIKYTDAEFVDIIHSDAGVFGLGYDVGHADYYPNGGSEQPGCLTQTCSHSRAWEFLAASILNPQAFPAKKCQDWAAFKNGDCDDEVSYMGYGSRQESKGRYFCLTDSRSPFGLGEKGTVYTKPALTLLF